MGPLFTDGEIEALEIKFKHRIRNCPPWLKFTDL